ncbi:MAG: glucosamine-6-phosphate deaminase [Dehalococcoidia bacterium]|nr:glucosamine-6-phosphate deaminase [Dehalococcoidia bacterium]
MPPRVDVVPAARFAGAALDELIALATRYAHPVVGLPTGKTPVGLYGELARLAAQGQADVRLWRPFAIDEYCGPRNHPCSNRSFFSLHWSAIPGAAAVEQFDPEAADLEAEAAAFAGQLAEAGGLDIAVLGIGPNGHLAFNEPGSARDSTARVVTLHPESRASGAACWGDETPTLGLTLGLVELLAAPSVLLLADGAAKAGIVARALRGPISPDCPASFLQEHPNVTVILDEAAATA